MSFLQQQQAIARRVSAYRLQYAQETALRLDDLSCLNIPPEHRGNQHFLAYYSPEGIDYALNVYGVYRELAARGFPDVRLVLNMDDPYQHRLALYAGDPENPLLLHEIVLRRRQFCFDAHYQGLQGRHFQFLGVDWLCLQNPLAAFSPERPALPGQLHPGLGMSHFVMALIQISTERLGLDGVLTIPAWLHNAVLYKQAFHYLDPHCEGRLQALQRDLIKPMGLAAASWAVEKGEVNENGKPFSWFHADQLLPVHPDLKKWFHSLSYYFASHHASLQHHYTCDNPKDQTSEYPSASP